MNYRLGDLIRFHKDTCLKFPQQSLARQYFVNSKFPKSEHRIIPVQVDFEALREIIDKKKFPTVQQLAIHLRLGDVYKYRAPIKKYIKIIDKNIDFIDTRKCKIFCKSHKNRPKLNRQTNAFVKELSEEIKKLGFKVEFEEQCFNPELINSWEYIDNDFLEIANSKYLIAGKRGFGWLSACMNKNNVFWGAYNFKNGFPNLKWDKRNRTKPKWKKFSHHIGHMEGYIYQRKNDQLFNLVKTENPPRYRA